MVDAPEAWEYPKPGTEDEIAAARAAQSEDAPRASIDPGPPSASGGRNIPAPQYQQLGTYQHYHHVGVQLPFASAAAQGITDPTRQGPLPWGYPWPGPYPGSKTGYGPPPPGTPGFDEEAAAIAAQLFAQGPLRKAFMQKVLGIVCAQLLVTALVAALFYLCKPVKLAVYRHPWVWFLAWAVTFVCVVTLAYNERARRSYPTNWITLCIFTLSFGVLVGIGTSYFDTRLLVEALALTCVTCAAIFVIVSSTSVDFTQAGGFLWTCGFVLVLCVLFGSFIEDNVFWVVISGAGSILFAAYLLYDLQKLMGGRYLAVHPDDYVYAAVQARACMQYLFHVYLDVVTLFLLLLAFFSLTEGAGGAAAAPIPTSTV
ncbi:g6771 [Coccomyxa viridis]|uniref:G6771 protein n=1 Tax=Coccomyxa viridis TaxID=1274662 RepID=A0ABP1FW78_9CHLO